MGKGKRKNMALTDSTAPPPTPEFAAFIGLDWGDQKHAWSLQQQGSTRIERGEMENTPEAMDLWAVALAQRFGGRLIAVALEQARGAVIGVLSKYAYFYLYPVHSTTSANYRKSFSPSGAKSDPTGADMLLDLLLKHREQLRALRPDTEPTRSLQILVEERRKQVDLQTWQSQRLTTHLKQSFPQILKWFDDVKAPLVANFTGAVAYPGAVGRRPGPRRCASSFTKTIAGVRSASTNDSAKSAKRRPPPMTRPCSQPVF
jgi:hypothetical protein